MPASAPRMYGIDAVADCCTSAVRLIGSAGLPDAAQLRNARMNSSTVVISIVSDTAMP